MADAPVKGRLVALDGTSGRDLTAAARRLLRLLDHPEGSYHRTAAKRGGLRRAQAAPSLSRGGVSPWDASGLFTELAAGSRDLERPSPRTLTILYAADLAFRLRWQIRPALAEGRIVVAAPYVETALALGAAAGLPAPWLDALFRFAPAPDATYRLKEAKKKPSRKADGGYVEFVCHELKRHDRDARVGRIRKACARYLAGRNLLIASRT